MKILIDTNIVLDFFLSREPGNAFAKQIFKLICKETVKAYTTASSITDIYYISAKKLGNDKARNAIKLLLKLLSIINVDGDDCSNALIVPMNDFEDALITVCADKVEVDYIISNDNEFLQTDSIIANVISSQNFMNSIRSK